MRILTRVDANGFRIYRRGCEQFLNFFNAHTRHSRRHFLKDMAAVSRERFSIRDDFGEVGEPSNRLLNAFRALQEPFRARHRDHSRDLLGDKPEREYSAALLGHRKTSRTWTNTAH